MKNGLIIMVGLSFSGLSAVGATRYVKTNGTGNCSSWANACSMSTGLSGASEGDQLWAQSGTYGPIALVNGVKVIGGFAGTESAASQSNPSTNETIIDGDDDPAVESINHSTSTVLRGFTIKDGREDSFEIGGGGVLIQDSSALFVQCTFKNNNAAKFGAAAMVRGNSSPQFINCKFFDNGSGSGTSATPLGGGAVLIYSGSPQFTNCLFYNNKAGEGGAIGIISGTPTLTNCTIVNSQATVKSGGGLFDNESAASLKNCIVWGNTAAGSGAQIYNSAYVSSPTNVTYSDVQGAWTGSSNINSDPLFVDATNFDFRLQSTSPCRNAGPGSSPALPADVGDLDWDNNLTEPIPKDLNMSQRRVGVNVDMGAYEFQVGGGGGGGGD